MRPVPRSTGAPKLSPPSVDVHTKVRSVMPPAPQFQQLAAMMTRPSSSAWTVGTLWVAWASAPGNGSAWLRSQAAPPRATRQYSTWSPAGASAIQTTWPAPPGPVATCGSWPVPAVKGAAPAGAATAASDRPAAAAATKLLTPTTGQP
jgi:hypothetical protein